MTEPLIEFLGRLHPLVLHVPIGAVIALAACELAGLVRRRPLDTPPRVTLAAVVFAGALAAAASGWLFANEPGSGGRTLDWHRWLGVAFAAASLITLASAARDNRRTYVVSLAACVLLVVPTGHLGAELTHGKGFLTRPFRQAPAIPEAVLPTPASGPRLPDHVASFFATHCVSCHGPDRQRGGLALHTPQAVFEGGDYGPVITPDVPEMSELGIRLLLPIDDELRMPPGDKPQPSTAEVDALLDWIASGAPLVPAD